MGVIIDCEKKEVLDLSNRTFEAIYEAILSIIEEKKLSLSDDFKTLLEEMSQGAYGVGCDIADFIQTKQDVILLADLVAQAIKSINWTMPVAKEVVEHLWAFHAEILKYAETLS